MAELGAESERYHAEIASLLDELGIEVVVAVGDEAQPATCQGVTTGSRFPTHGRSTRSPPCFARATRSSSRGRGRSVSKASPS